jgi:hypothetical protein
MISCGIMPTSKRLVAVVLDDAGRARKPIHAASSKAAAEALVEYLVEEIHAEIVLVEILATEPIGLASAATGRLWIAPTNLVETVRRAAALSPRRTAAMLARLPRDPALRSQLRRKAAPDPKQLALL